MDLTRRPTPRATEERASVSTIELFFDLVFVFAVTMADDLMADDPTVINLLHGILVLAVLWWAWVCYSWLGNVVRADEGVVRVTMLAAMSAVFVIALTIPEAFDDLPGGLDGPMVFALAYFVVRALHILMFLVISREDPQLRGQVWRFVPSMLAGTVFLLIASQLTGVWQVVMWGLALAGDYLGTLVGGAALYLAALVVFEQIGVGAFRLARVVTVVALLALIPVVWHAPALAALGVLAVVLLALVGYETTAHAEQRRVRHLPVRG
ncbi:low temperature requirement protein A [Prescottella subtropica]|uniref:low temperature requirement protein A n=1 Tax=Prescottella subtropica TaxID=2545757 RepID=UPI001F4F4A87|nr:low temperature requirement protein A [Prescottella subtropica]